METINGVVEHLLLVEDEAIIALDERQRLEREGYRVSAVSNGEEAVALVATDESIALVLMDIDLGDGIDGIEAARRIMANGMRPIIFLTSHREPEIVERVQAVTRYGYILKNSGTFALVQAIRVALELYHS